MEINIIYITNIHTPENNRNIFFFKLLIFYIVIIYYECRYEIQWYITPMYVQKFILFLLLRGNKSFGLNVGGLFTSSLQCFATV